MNTLTALYRNEGEGSFSAVSADFPEVAYGDVAWGDYDDDGDLDLLLSGAKPDGAFVTTLYRNDGDGAFAEAEQLPGLAFSSLVWGDYDNDGDLDILLSGGELDPELLSGRTFIYSNESQQFEVAWAMQGTLYGSASWGDYDGDGKRDMLQTGGRKALGLRVGRIFKNRGYRFDHTASLTGALTSETHWGDYDNDGDLDVASAGLNNESRIKVNLFKNTQPQVNTRPEAPGGLEADVTGRTVTLSWEAAADAQTPSAGLSYNLRVGTTPGGVDVMSPLAEPETGYRLVSRRGNAGSGLRWRLEGLAPGTYYWSVQAIDGSYKGSSFASEGQFTISSGKTASDEQPVPPSWYALHAGYPNPFQHSTTLPYDLPTPAHVTLAIYNVLGEKVRTLVDRSQPAGRQRATWDGRNGQGQRLSPGVYIVRFQANGRTHTRRITLVK